MLHFMWKQVAQLTAAWCSAMLA